MVFDNFLKSLISFFLSIPDLARKKRSSKKVLNSGTPNLIWKFICNSPHFIEVDWFSHDSFGEVCHRGVYHSQGCFRYFFIGINEDSWFHYDLTVIEYAYVVVFETEISSYGHSFFLIKFDVVFSEDSCFHNSLPVNCGNSLRYNYKKFRLKSQ